MSSYTSSYPDRCMKHRPMCLACMTAATGDSAPSNRRVRVAPASWSYGQESPGRKGFHALFFRKLPMAESGECWRDGGYAGIQPRSSKVARPVRQRHRSIASRRANAMTVFLRIELPSASLTFMR